MKKPPQIPSDDYLADSETMVRPTKKPLQTKTIFEDCNILNPALFQINLGAAINAAQANDTGNSKLIRAKKYFEMLDTSKHLDIIKLILLANLLTSENLIDRTFLPQEFPAPLVIERKLVAFYTEVKEAIHGKPYRRPTPLQESEEPTTTEMAYEMLSALGVITKIAVQLSVGYIATTTHTVTERMNGLVHHGLFARNGNPPPQATDLPRESLSGSWQVIPGARESL